MQAMQSRRSHQTIESKLCDAKAKLMLKDGFTGQIVSYLKLVCDPSKAQTMATDGHTIYYSEKFLDHLDKNDIIFALAHEAWHVMMKHHIRGKGKDNKLFNRAADHVVNLLIKDTFRYSNKLKPLCDPQYIHLSAEEVYDKLLGISHKNNSDKESQESQESQEPQESQDQSNQSNQGEQNDQSDQDNQDEQGDQGDQGDQSDQSEPNDPNDQGAQGDQEEEVDYDQPIEDFGQVLEPEHIDKTLSEKDDSEQQSQEIDRKLHQAYMSAGHKLSPTQRKQIKALITKPKAAWHVILQQYIDQIVQKDYSWQRPNKRYGQSDVIMPSLYSKDIINVVICIDSSGSISNQELKLYATYVSDLLENYPEIETTVIYHNTDPLPQYSQTYAHADLPIVFEIDSGGGTQIATTIKYIDEMDDTPRFVIWFTDMQFWDEPEYIPSWPIYFMDTCHDKHTNNRYRKYGEVIEI